MNSMKGSGEFQEVESNHSGRLSCVPSQPAGIPSSRSMPSCDKRLQLDTWNMSGPQENVFGNFVLLHLIRPEIIITGSVPVHIGSSADMCKKVVDHVFIDTAGYSAEFYGWTAKTAKIGTLIRQLPYTFHIFMLEDEIQKPRISCFTVCALVFGGTALESASDDGGFRFTRIGR